MSTWIVLIFFFIAAALLAVWVFDALFPDEARRRLADLVESSPHAARRVRRNHLIDVLARVTEPISKLATPDKDSLDEITLLLAHAGLRQKAASAAYFGAKAALTLLLPLITLTVLPLLKPGQQTFSLVTVLVPAAIGYYLPTLLLRMAVKHRRQRIIDGMPDAIDLMTICVEAGLSMDSAMTRVAEDFTISNPVLGEELKIIGMETRAGLNRALALRNFYARTGVDEVDSFVTMVMQAERFGTSIAEALRVHSDTMRTRRRQQVEEAAAKIGTKLLFPLILCLFPGLIFVLVGPSVIQFVGLMSTK
ncbi:MAG: type II secretion system F family protein [Aquabacterium sp.]|uniref:type II secretion system F family protein n=1 Tax=Aquabacterium sp. TaxID=1872578 RepID=UPI0025BE949A|nr:type II secretion system F family protein [Aquabacterium sp.]MBI3381537.1 type II secretion system F family protein [Aquabacterium sp.]